MFIFQYADSSNTFPFIRLACASNGDGSFGGTSGSQVSVTYNFEMVTTADGSTSDALKNLEASIANLILSFTLGCDDENRRNLKIGSAQRKRHLEIAGLSSMPDDVVTPDGKFQSH